LSSLHREMLNILLSSYYFFILYPLYHKSILKKTTGNVSVASIDTAEALTEKISPFDTFVQIIDGKAEILIDGISNLLETGQSIIIPAHSSNTVKSKERFKMISTTIKSGYE